MQSSWTEKGYAYLRQEDYVKALDCFQKAIDEIPSDHRAHFGLLLAEYQRPGVDELIASGFVYDHNEHFQNACREATDSEAQRYRAEVVMALQICHATFMEFYERRECNKAKLRSVAYKRSKLGDPRVAWAQDMLLQPSSADVPWLQVRQVLLREYTKPGNVYPPQQFSNPERARLIAASKELQRRLQRMFENLNVSDASLTQKLRFFADPMSDGAKGHPMLGADGCPSVPCERMLYVLRQLTNHAVLSGSVARARWLLAMLKEAQMGGAAASAVEECRERVVQTMLKGVSDDTVYAFLKGIAPTDVRVYQARIQTMTTVTSAGIPERQLKTLLAVPVTRYCAADVQEQITRQNRELEWIRARMDKAHRDIDPVANTLLSVAGVHFDEQKAWVAAVFAKMQAAVDAQEQAMERDLRAMLDYKARLDREAEAWRLERRRTAKRRCVTALGVTAGLTAVMVAAVLVFVWLLCHPSTLAPVSSFWFLAITCGAALVAAIGFGVTAAKMADVAENFEGVMDAASGVCKAACAVLPMMAVACAVLASVTVAKVPTALGVMNVATADDLETVRRHPACDYVLTADLVLTEADSASLPYFSGILDGQGHTVSGLSGTTFFIKTNRGDLSNLTVSAVAVADEWALVKTNHGIINAVRLCNVTAAPTEEAASAPSFYGLCRVNRGELTDSRTDNVSGAFARAAGVCEINRGKVHACRVETMTVSGSDEAAVTCEAAGAVLKNRGDLTRCVVKELTIRRAVITNGGGLCADGGGTIENCAVHALSVNAAVDGRFGGLTGVARGVIAHSEAHGTVTATDLVAENPSGVMLGGLVGEQCSADIHNCRSRVGVTVTCGATPPTVMLGGVAGGVRGHSEIRECVFSAPLNVTLTNACELGEKRSTMRFGRVDGVYVGGVYGQQNEVGFRPTVKDCMTLGSAEVTLEPQAIQTIPIWVGGLSAESRGNYETSYSTMTIRAAVPLAASNRFAVDYILVGGFVADDNPHQATRCFFAGTVQNDLQSGAHMSVPPAVDGLEDSVYADTSGYEGEAVVPSHLFGRADYALSTLQFSEDVWSIEEGSFPKLKSVGVLPLEEEPIEQGGEHNA